MIRLAKQRDKPRLCALARELYEEVWKPKGFTFEIASVQDTFDELMGREDVVVIVAELDGVVVGMAIAVLAPCMFDAGYVVAQERVWFLGKEYRGKGLGVKLLEALEMRCSNLGAMQMFIALASVYEHHIPPRLGYELAERHYMKGI